MKHRHRHYDYKRFNHKFFRGLEKKPFDQNDVRRFKRYITMIPIVFILINVFIFYFFIKLITAGNGIFIISIIASIILLREIMSYMFARRLSKKILEPIEKLRNAVDEVSVGNYGITVDGPRPRNEVGQLIKAFNHMSVKLKESEELKKKYELNRKNLIASISHDLKTPITSIMGYVQGIQEGVAESPEKLDKYINIIYQNAVYTNKLINDLFLFSKLDIQQLEFDFIDTPIKAFMDDLMTELRLELKEQDIELKFEDRLEDELLLKIDGKRIRQVILNIINNAIKYNDKECIKLDCSMIMQKDGVQIDIGDNGAGIEPDKIDTIFNRFYRGDKSRSKDIGGTGLGLAIAKELIRAHNGEIWAESQMGEGTIIHFTIHNSL